MSGSEFLPPDEMSLDAAADTIGDHLRVRNGVAVEADRAFYDTFDGLVRAAGLSVVHENRRLSLRERASGRERAALAIAQPRRPLLVDEIESGPLRDALRTVIDVRALVPLAKVHSRTRALDVLDDELKTVVRVTLEQPELVSSERGGKALRPRLRLVAVRGYDQELERVQRTLQHELGFEVADQPLIDEAVRAAGGSPAGTSSKIEVAVSPGQRSDAVAVQVLSRLLEVIESNLPGAVAGIDAEFLHDLRVAVRRTRAVQRQLKPVFPPGELARFREDFRWLQQVTGDARDLDVHVLEFDAIGELVPADARGDLEPLRTVLVQRRQAARQTAADALRGWRSQRLRENWGTLLEELVEAGTDDRPAAERPIAELVGARIRKVYKRMVKMGNAIDSASPPAAYHDLRKRGKELRYLLELFAVPLYPDEVGVKPMIKTLKALQDALGRHQDREVQIATLRSLAEDIGAGPGGAAALIAMGGLLQRLREDEQAARDEFFERFAAFSSPSQRRWVKVTFA